MQNLMALAERKISIIHWLVQIDSNDFLKRSAPPILFRSFDPSACLNVSACRQLNMEHLSNALLNIQLHSRVIEMLFTD